jgi:predicted negative regulator of RcsB-dependent stress response
LENVKMAYETEEQQVEALKKWWQENGRYLIAGVVLGLGILFGWNSWKNHKETQGMAASDLYSQLTKAVESSSLENAKAFEEKLMQDYDGTPYAALSALTMARLYVEQDNLAEAEAKLRWTMDNADELELKEVSRVRLAQVLVAAEKYNDVLSLLDDLPTSYTSLTDELRGDVLRAQGKIDEARAAYDRALLTAGGRGAEYLQLKRDALGKTQEGVS